MYNRHTGHSVILFPIGWRLVLCRSSRCACLGMERHPATAIAPRGHSLYCHGRIRNKFNALPLDSSGYHAVVNMQ